MTSIAVTGANGLVGSSVASRLASQGHEVVGIVRPGSLPAAYPAGGVFSGGIRFVPYIAADTDWMAALSGVEVVIHCAALTTPPRSDRGHALRRMRDVNVLGAARLAEHSSKSGVRRLVFISSAKASGQRSEPGKPLRIDDPPRPEDAYGLGKLEAEAAIREIGDTTSMQTVMIRPPMVYGPHAKGNFARLLSLIHRRVPLPFGSVYNRRSMVYLENLADFIALCSLSPDVKGGTYHVSDNRDVCLTDLLREVGLLMRRPALLLPFPVRGLKALGYLSGRGSDMDRLTENLQLDISASLALGWSPPYQMAVGLEKTVQAYITRG
jgi:UDP-glucose 4-epimerase